MVTSAEHNDEALFQPAAIAGLTLRNRVIKAATFEGMCPGGEPSDALIDHHRTLAQGGVGMTTVAYCSVSQDGRTYAHQLWMRPKLVPSLRRLTDAVHQAGAAVSLQIGHAGSFAEPKVIGGRPLAPSRQINLYGLSLSRAMTRADMQRIRDDFVRASQLAVEAGFDAIELHVGHGYLLSQFLSPYSNRRRDDYGGSLTGRLRYVLEVTRALRESLPQGFPLLAKTNVSDGFEGGLQLSEACEVARALSQAGIDALVPSGGFVSKTPLYMLRGEVPVKQMAEVQTSLHRRLGLRLFGRLFVQRYDYTPMFFWDEARAIREAVDVPVALLGGITSLAHMRRALDDGFSFVVLGRALINEPALVHKLRDGVLQASRCVPCNRCIAEMDRGGVRCVLPPLRRDERVPDQWHNLV